MLSDASMTEIQEELFKREMVAVPLDLLKDAQRALIAQQWQREDDRDFKHADALKRWHANRSAAV